MTASRSAGALIVCVAVYSVVLGGSYAALAVDLAGRGFGPRDVALNAAMTPLGLFVAAMMLPRLVKGPILPWLLAAIGGSAVVLASLAATDSFIAWLVLRFALGFAANTLFVVAESALMVAIPARSSGRFLSIYNGVVTGGYAAGPLALALVPIDLELALWIGAAIVLASAFPLARRVPKRGLSLPPLEVGSGLLGFAIAAPALVVGSAATAIFDNAALSLFPLSLMETGIDRSTALLALAALLAGATVLQWPIGVMADRRSPLGVLRCCCLAAIVSCLALPAVATIPLALGLVGFVAGGAAFGAYSMILALVKERFETGALVTANSMLGVAWGIGALVGVPLVGAGMESGGADLFGPLVAVPFTILLATSLLPIGRRAPTPRRSHRVPEPAPDPAPPPPPAPGSPARAPSPRARRSSVRGGCRCARRGLRRLTSPAR